MSAASNYVEDKTLDFWLKANSAATSAPSTVYVGLFLATVDSATTSANLEAGTITDEVSGNGYARKAVTFGTVSGGSVSNSANVTFDPASGGDWGTITHIAVMDASTSGNVLFYGTLDTSKQIQDGDTFQVTTGNLTVTLA